MMNKRLRGLYVITDPTLCEDKLVEKVEQAIIGGAQIVQYRNKQAPVQQRLEEATSLNQLCQQHQRLFIVNDDVELAARIDADGLHIGQSDASLQQARTILGENKIIGVSCNNQLQWAIDAQQAGADYVAFGRFFNSQTKPQAPQADPDMLTQAKAQLDIPLVAIGGITLENANSLLTAGADMLAVIHAIFSQQDIAEAARQIQQQFP
jgi:thiamine-phosphate pyrophosphorylase